MWMKTPELIRVSLFCSVVLGVYAAAAWVIVAWCRRGLTSGAPPLSRRQISLRRVILGLAGLGLLSMAYGYFVEPRWLEVTRVRLESSTLPPGSRPIRIVLLSDLHSRPKPLLEERLPDIVAGENPDLIAFVGDSLESPDGLPVFKRCLRRLAALAPTFVVAGNWEVEKWHALDPFGGIGVRELDGEGVRLKVRGGAELWVTGAPMYGEEKAQKALREAPPGLFTLFLYHSPDLIEYVSRRKADLYCAGHSHGGQVALPLYGALVTYSRFGKRYEAGLYRVGQTWLYVNRGIGMTNGHLPVRFCARPEVTVIDVVAAR